MTSIEISQLHLTSKEGWQKWKLAHAFNLIGSGTTPPTGSVEYFKGEIPWVNTGDLNDGYIYSVNKFVSEKAIIDFSALKVFPKNSLIIALYGATIGKLGILQIDACTNQACCILAEPNHFDTKFVFYWLMSERNNIIELAQGGGQPNISQEIVKSLRVFAPNIAIQKSIANFLDRKTAAIDALIAKKQRLIQLLEEKRTALINQAVTKGLNPNAPMKDSGIPWIGKIPEHWEVLRLRRLISDKVAGPYGSSLTKSMYVSAGYRVYGQQQVIPGNFTVGDYYISPEKFLEMQRYLVQPKDVLVTVMGTIGRVAVVPEGIEPGIINPRLVKYVVRQKYILPHFFAWVFRSKAGEAQLSEMAQGVTMDGLNLTVLSDLWMPVPPLGEQNNIVTHIYEITDKNNQLQRVVREQIQKLQEYRRSLITAAVTGKLDINNLNQET